MPICLRLLAHKMVLADFLALSKLGSNIAMSNEIIDMTTSNSIRVKLRLTKGVCETFVRGIGKFHGMKSAFPDGGQGDYI